MKMLLKGGILTDPASGTELKTDILIKGKRVERIGKNLKSPGKTFDIRGKRVLPGFIDLHTHLREPGREDTETIASGTKAGAKGGFTTLCSMPNTDPPVDSVSGVKYILTTCAQEGKIRVLPAGCITKNRGGSELTEVGKMSSAGIVAVSDDGSPVMNSLVMRRAMEYAGMFGIPVISHCEDIDLSREGMMNEGLLSTMMGLRGIPCQAETVMAARDIALAELTGCRLHIAHVSAERTAALIRDAKKRGIPVTAEVTPHHLTLTETSLKGYDTNFKVNPPLRSEKDRKALLKYLKDGTIDCVATDHAPHLDTEKAREFYLAPFGVTGLETAFAVLFTYLVEKKKLHLISLAEKMTLGPARVLGRDGLGRISPGGEADITVIDTYTEKTITEDFFLSKSRNSPYLGKKLKGFPVLTLYGGRVAFKDNEHLS